jgi:hypothetical protein
MINNKIYQIHMLQKDLEIEKAKTADYIQITNDNRN